MSLQTGGGRPPRATICRGRFRPCGHPALGRSTSEVGPPSGEYVTPAALRPEVGGCFRKWRSQVNVLPERFGAPHPELRRGAHFGNGATPAACAYRFYLRDGALFVGQRAAFRSIPPSPPTLRKHFPRTTGPGLRPDAKTVSLKLTRIGQKGSDNIADTGYAPSRAL